MKMRRYEVSQEDIDKGIPRECRFCPVARAVQRGIGRRGWVVEVKGRSITFLLWRDWQTGGGIKRSVTLDLPWEVKNLIWDFDDGKPIEPFSFELPDLGAIL